MPVYRKLFLLTLTIILCVCAAHAQKKILQRSIYFETAGYLLNDAANNALQALADSVQNFKAYSIVINGYTDNVGSDTYNQKLAGRRVSSAKQYLIGMGIDSTLISSAAFGELSPLGDNTTDDGKRMNRRIDILISYEPKQMIAAVQDTLPFIRELYKQTERKPQVFCINAARDTTLRCAQGTLVYIKANSFQLPPACNKNCVTIKIKEDFLRSDMLLDNLTTTSNGAPIETQGMVYTEANDCAGNKLNLANGKDMVIFMPTDTVRADAKIFDGEWLGGDSLINWIPNNNAVLSHAKRKDLDDCGSFLCGGVAIVQCPKCPFFFCRIGRVGQALKGLVSNSAHAANVSFRNCRQTTGSRAAYGAPVSAGDDGLAGYSCQELKALMDKYGVSNVEQLLLAMNRHLLDSFGVKTMAELRDTMQKVKTKNIELSYMGKTISYNDLNYYVFNLRRLGWINVDCFSNLKNTQLTTMYVNIKPERNVDCKLAFKQRRVIYPSEWGRNMYEFPRVPKGEEVWVIAVKYLNSQPYIAIVDANTSDKPIDMEFKQVSLAELKEQLKILDN
jgi:hypothetical protein